jgi:hypothetical protein
MSDYRNPDFDPFDPNDPYRRGAKMDPDLRPNDVVTGWFVAAVFVVAVLAVVFGMTHRQTQLGTDTAANDVASRTASPAITHMAPPAPAPQAAPSPSPTTAPPSTTPPINPVPSTPGPSNGGQ